MRRILLPLVALAIVAGVIFLLVRRPASPTTAPPPSPSHGVAVDAAPPPPGNFATTRTATPPRPTHDAGARSSVIVSATWGSGPGQLGRRVDPESVTEGPMSFLVDKSGAVVLDNVNKRLARFDAHGKPLPPVALPGDAAQDLARGPHDAVAVLDRLHDKTLTLYGSDGKKGVSVPLVGAGIEEPGGVTGVFGDRAGDLYVEREHGSWLRFVDAGGDVNPARKPAPGRPTRDGRFISAAIADRAAGTVRVQMFNSDGSASWSEIVGFGAPIMYVALLDSDAAGELFIAAHTGRESTTPPYRIGEETLAAVALTPLGDELGRMTLPAPPPHEEAFRDLYVGDDGRCIGCGGRLQACRSRRIACFDAFYEVRGCGYFFLPRFFAFFARRFLAP